MEYVLVSLFMLFFGTICFYLDSKHRIINELLKNTPKQRQLANEIAKCELCYVILAIVLAFLMIFFAKY